MPKQVYLKNITRTEVATPTLYTKDERVEPGKLLVILNLSVSWAAMATTEPGCFYIDDGGQKVFLGDDVPAKAGGQASWSGNALVGEGDLIGVYTPDSASADIISFDIVGELWDLKEWEEVRS